MRTEFGRQDHEVETRLPAESLVALQAAAIEGGQREVRRRPRMLTVRPSPRVRLDLDGDAPDGFGDVDVGEFRPASSALDHASTTLSAFRLTLSAAIEAAAGECPGPRCQGLSVSADPPALHPAGPGPWHSARDGRCGPGDQRATDENRDARGQAAIDHELRPRTAPAGGRLRRIPYQIDRNNGQKGVYLGAAKPCMHFPGETIGRCAEASHSG